MVVGHVPGLCPHLADVADDDRQPNNGLDLHDRTLWIFGIFLLFDGDRTIEHVKRECIVNRLDYHSIRERRQAFILPLSIWSPAVGFNLTGFQ